MRTSVRGLCKWQERISFMSQVRYEVRRIPVVPFIRFDLDLKAVQSSTGFEVPV